VQWIEERPFQPFFAVLWTFQSHYPYFAETPRARRLDPAVPAKRVREEKQRYLDALAEADVLIDALLRRLEHAGRLEQTLVIVTADHGQAFGERGTYGNGTSVHEESVRIPLILINSGLRAGSFRRISGQIDVAPTILDLLGRPPPESWDGASLIAAVPERPIYFVNTTADLVLGYRVRDRKVITNLVRGTTEIYDLSADPTETNDLSNALGDGRIREEQAWLALWASRVNKDWKSRKGQSAGRR
jgi:arylsulfatase A-like enzyme